MTRETSPTFHVPVIEPHKKNTRKSAICFLGGFYVTDRYGKDITREFTPMLRQLFLLILLHTYKNQKGISSQKLKEALWFDKTDESAKNNRSVSISKLRLIFQQIRELNIKSNSSYWTITIENDIYCDYAVLLDLMKTLSEGGEIKIEDLKKLLTISSSGELLPNIQTEWVDSFKTEFSNTLIDLLLSLSKHPEIKKKNALIIQIANAIFIHDSLNEEALKLKCSVLVKPGKNGLARQIYASFQKEYYSLFGSPFDETFEQVINF